MNKEICKIVVEQKTKFIPYLFTKRQITLLEKYITKKNLTNTEKVYLYSTISKKIEALGILREEFYVTGEEMVRGRVTKAKELLNKLGYEQAFVSGSFLYNQKYQDIDVYVVGRRRKQYHRDNLHLIFITEHDLCKPLFFSAMLYSVANFQVEIKPIMERASLAEILLTYQMAINEILDNTDQKTVRQLLFYYALIVKKKVISSYALFKEWKQIINLAKQEKILKVQQLTKEILLNGYAQRYVYQETLGFEQRINELKKEYDTENLPIYLHLIAEVKNECRRAEA